MGKVAIYDYQKIVDERKAFQGTLEYWVELKSKHPEKEKCFDENIAIARAKVEAFDFVLNQCQR
jgi:hypothetical protein